MGCASSRQKRCWHCRAPCSPVPRSYTMHVHHPSQHKGDSYHVVALTSTTLGNLKVESNHQSNGNLQETKEKSKLEAEVWSKLIEDKLPKIVPKTPVRTPPGEPETINTWELMAGLEDSSPRPPTHFKSYSANENDILYSKPLWAQSEEDEGSDSVMTDFDPEIISSFRKTLEQLPSSNPFHLNPCTIEKVHCKLNKDKVILYFTSLRGVRKTYEDCCNVRLILKGLGVRMDERDVSIHSRFKDELREVLGEGFKGGLPRVFVGKKYIGGAEEIKQMHEEGSLGEAIEGCEMLEDDDVGACEACGDIRFVPCETCSGSCKVYYDEDEGEVTGNEGDESEYGFQRCPDCNENGLIRCPVCCD
ncbi:homeobox-leucine zipper protein HAT7-like [Hibiscus syriacus]|uniref:Homeobox-leucine zipper protein HAT7-like n=1 Tax=Hibiscus syriacus TaxID=106335 RepID=A0A6A2ZT42_HIBSY|nr:uncharacterized protein At3g28850-like [Hibiscus syriacus]KAE8694332.1 homeobox-leucine zipper protein HAT7-like [Hibiscus syriacus]